MSTRAFLTFLRGQTINWVIEKINRLINKKMLLLLALIARHCGIGIILFNIHNFFKLSVSKKKLLLVIWESPSQRFVFQHFLVLMVQLYLSLRSRKEKTDGWGKERNHLLKSMKNWCKVEEEKLFSQKGRRKAGERASDWVYGNIEPQSIYVRSKLILIFGKRIQ